MGHIERFNPAVRRLHELIEDGALGRITSCIARRVGVMPPRVRDADIVVDLAVHDIDVLGYLLGSYPERVRATGGRAWLSDRTDHAEILLDYGSVGCFIQVNWQTPVRIRTLAVTGESGYCELNYVTQELLHYRTPDAGPVATFEEFVRRYGESTAELLATVRTEPLRIEIEGFLAAVRGDGAIVSASRSDRGAAGGGADQLRYQRPARGCGRPLTVGVDQMPERPVKAHLFRLSGQTAVYGIAGATLPLIGLITLPVFTHVFTTSQYGALEIVVVAAGAVAVVIDLGLGMASQRSYYHYRAEDVSQRKAVIATTAATSIATACLAAALIIAFSAQVSDLLLGTASYSSLVAVTGLVLPIGVLAQLGREVMRLTLRPWPFMVSSVLSAVVGATAAIYLVTAGTAELQEVQWGALVGAVLASIYGIVVVRGELALTYSRSELRVMLRYGLPLVPSGLALWGLALLDRFILEKLDGLDEVGLYGVANRAASVALLAVVAFTTAWGPFMLSLHADDAEEERRVRARVLVYVAVLFGFVALLLGLFAREALDIVAPSFEGAANAVGLLALGLACQGVGVVAAAGITIARKTPVLVTYTVAALVVNVALCFALIPSIGQVGAATATLASYGVLAVLQYRGAQRFDRAPFEPLRVVLALLICAAPLPLGALLEPSFATLVIKLAALVLTLALLFVTGVLGPLERAWLRELVRGRGHAA